MKTKLSLALLLLGWYAHAQTNSPLDPLSYGVVLDHPAMQKVVVKTDITYLKDAKGSLTLDVYLPPGLGATEKRPAVIFLNAIGERPGEPKLKSWGIYTSWPKLMAAHGYIGISMETDGERIPESIQGIFDFIAAQGSQYHIDRDRLGVYAASANVTLSAQYLMQANAYSGIKAAVLYYGSPPAGPYRKDLPVLFVVAEGDVRPQYYDHLWQEVLKNNAPWTIKMGTGMPHAFDAFSDNDEARKIVKETISFWQNHLDPVPAPAWPYSKGRDMLGHLQMDRPRALELLKSLVAEYPNDVNTLFFYADALRQSQAFDEAEKYYQKVIGLQPKNTGALIQLATICYTSGRTAEAESYATRAVQAGPVDRNLYIQLGYALLVANKNAEAATYYEKALALGPGALDYYNLACAYAKINDTEKALPALEKAIEYGYSSRQQFENDPDLDSLKSDQRFKDLLKKTQ